MGFKVQILGISSATPTLSRNPSAQVILGENESYLIDCGEGTQLQFLKFGAKMFRIRNIFISHLHPDHFAGLLTMLSTMGMNGRKDSIIIFCPIGLKQILEAQFYYSGGQLSYPIHFVELYQKEKTLIFENEELQVFSLKLSHGIDCWGFFFQEKFRYYKINKDKIEDLILDDKVKAFSNWRIGKDYIDNSGQIYSFKDFTVLPLLSSYAYFTDTLFLPDLADEFKGIHTLYHESTYLESDKDKAGARFHSTAQQAGIMAKVGGVKKLILGHFSARYNDLRGFQKEASAECMGTEVIIAEEGSIYETK